MKKTFFISSVVQKYVKFALWCAFIPFWVLFSHCGEKSTCLKSSGEITKEKRFPAAYHSVEINDVFDVKIISSSQNKIEIKGGGNLLPYIETRVVDSCLIIEDNNRCKWLRDYKPLINIKIYSNTITNLHIKGPSIIFSDTLKAEKIRLNVYSRLAEMNIKLDSKHFTAVIQGTGNYHFQGKANKSFIHSRGSAHIFAQELITNRTELYYSATGDAYVHAKNVLFLLISGNATIYYAGNPDEIDLIDNGFNGELLPINN